jgi:hypothetical protein
MLGHRGCSATMPELNYTVDLHVTRFDKLFGSFKKKSAATPIKEQTSCCMTFTQLLSPIRQPFRRLLSSSAMPFTYEVIHKISHLQLVISFHCLTVLAAFGHCSQIGSCNQDSRFANQCSCIGCFEKSWSKNERQESPRDA